MNKELLKAASSKYRIIAKSNTKQLKFYPQYKNWLGIYCYFTTSYGNYEEKIGVNSLDLALAFIEEKINQDYTKNFLKTQERIYTLDEAIENVSKEINFS